MRLQFLAPLALFVAGSTLIIGCATESTAPPLQHRIIKFNGEDRVVMADPIDVLKPGDEVLIRHRGANSVAVVASQRGPGVYKLRNLEYKLLTVENYAGRLFNVRTAWAEGQAAQASGKSTIETAPVPSSVGSHTASPAAIASPKLLRAPDGIPASELHTYLLRLDELRKKGILTDTEFQAAKERLLPRLQ